MGRTEEKTLEGKRESRREEKTVAEDDTSN